MPAEQALLGALLANTQLLMPKIEFLRKEHFVDDAHGKLFAEIRRRHELGHSSDAVSLRTWCEGEPSWQELGVKYLANLLGAMVTPAYAEVYAREIISTAQRRAAIELATDLIERAYGSADIGPAISEAMLQLEGLQQDEPVRKGVMLGDAMAAAVAAGERSRELGGQVGISTGFASIDNVLGGLEAGAMYVLGARPGQGKTAIALQSAVAIAKTGLHVGFISLEMHAQQLGRRALALEANVPQFVLRRGSWGVADASRMVVAQRELRRISLMIEDEGSLTIGAIAARARAMKRKRGLDVLFIDHVHIVGADKNASKMGPTWAVEQVSGGIKSLAKSLEIPIVALAQLNRSVESREDKRPTMSDLRQSGALEQDSEAVMLLYRPEYYLAKSGPEPHGFKNDGLYRAALADWENKRDQVRGKAELIMAKVRDGEPGVVPLMFDGARTCFLEVER